VKANINLEDIYWMPASKSIDKKSENKQLIISKVGSKYVYATNVESDTEYQFTVESNGILKLVNNMVSNFAYSEEKWEKQKLIIELDLLTQKFRQEFLQVNGSTDFKRYQMFVDKMNILSQQILEN
jgi:hypothetical protein